MQLLSTLAFLAVAVQCAVAAPERNLLRSGYDRPINFSDLADLKTAASNPMTHQQPTHASTTTPYTPKGEVSGADASPHDKKSGEDGKTKVETDSTTLARRSGLQSVMAGKGAGKDGERPTKSRSGTDATKTVSGVTKNSAKPSNAVKSQPSSTNSRMKAYSLLTKSELPEERSMANPKKRPTPRTQGKYY
ncbi:hypothetical protein PHYSODRAFT_306147 [Phytophthora sojae]|uniref:RxLR effector protein n=1 Tax=Phytophthora sojae (strain P6497) TaxID=1094619 RepID=G5A826_PHYSP|nr:hypothetical protein PHYSODRAFT_306147 [Phytophthora sojae]EGZ08052.1 hypothetical protein PHYSODRAFT_306147 [Phytophthora sojae]|eukprot:XP_009536224.1 hypothetical protein PHYSODRAFT_306147 [Phytophthora sojae]